mmetsp:Transcript_4076/g.7842  ORF Transcript_4076/g.7842 Transcript_4076/m.7842 type:complete len:203 (-) Transcript_4076:675-1283(-)
MLQDNRYCLQQNFLLHSSEFAQKYSFGVTRKPETYRMLKKTVNVHHTMLSWIQVLVPQKECLEVLDNFAHHLGILNSDVNSVLDSSISHPGGCFHNQSREARIGNVQRSLVPFANSGHVPTDLFDCSIEFLILDTTDPLTDREWSSHIYHKPRKKVRNDFSARKTDRNSSKPSKCEDGLHIDSQGVKRNQNCNRSGDHGGES